MSHFIQGLTIFLRVLTFCSSSLEETFSMLQLNQTVWSELLSLITWKVSSRERKEERERKKIKLKCKSVKGLDPEPAFFLIKSKMRGEFEGSSQDTINYPRSSWLKVVCHKKEKKCIICPKKEKNMKVVGFLETWQRGGGLSAATFPHIFQVLNKYF